MKHIWLLFATIRCDNQVVQLVAVTIDSFQRADGENSSNDAAETDSRGRQYYDDWIKAYADAAVPQFANYVVIDQIMRRHFPDMDQANRFGYFGVYRDKHVNLQNKVAFLII